MKQRALIWYAKIKGQYPNGTILVVGHGFYLYLLLEVAVADGAESNPNTFLLDNASVTILDVPSEGAAKIIHLNDVNHLH